MLYRSWNRAVCLSGAMLAVLCLLVGCAVPENRVVYKDVNVGTWQQSATIEFSYSEEPRCSDVDLLLHVNRNFRPCDLGFEVTVITPDSLRYTEQIFISATMLPPMVTDRMEDIKIPYRRDMELAKKGEYNIVITPLAPLSDVEAVGVNFQLK